MSDFINNVRIRILDRNYASWCFYEVEERNEINIEEFPLLKKVNPLLSKIFTDDVINIDNLEKDNTVNIVNSVIRSNKQLAGVLHIENNKTFGRTENKKRLLYKCIPDDKHLPSFLHKDLKYPLLCPALKLSMRSTKESDGTLLNFFVRSFKFLL